MARRWRQHQSDVLARERPVRRFSGIFSIAPSFQGAPKA